MDKERYEAVELEVVEFEDADVITYSCKWETPEF